MSDSSYSKKLYNRHILAKGFIDGIPIGLGYFAVAFSLGITARSCGLNAFQGFLASFLNNASAGEYAGFTLIRENATLIEIALITLIANARYLLMSTALTQRLDSAIPLKHRMLMAYDITDEIFAITISKGGKINPYYMYGAFLIALPGWAFGTAAGIIAGNILPANIVSALSVALYGMFLAVIIPPARKDRLLLILIICCFLLSYIACEFKPLNSLSAGTRTIILTVFISCAAALLFPKTDDEECPGENNTKKE